MSSVPDPADAQPDLTEFELALRTIRRAPDSARLHAKLVRISGIDIDQSGFSLLQRLDHDGDLRLTDLAQLERVDLSVISRKVKQLEDAGYVERQPATDDRRATILRLSPSGRTGMERLRTERYRMLHRIFADWMPADVERLGTLLARFVDDASHIMEQDHQ